MQNEEVIFDYCQKTDLHTFNIVYDNNKVLAIAQEHGFRAIVVSANEIESIVKKKDKNSEIKTVAAIDYPLGLSSKNVRSYSVYVAKEQGADEIEISIPTTYINTSGLKYIEDDIQNLYTAANKACIDIRYVIEQNNASYDGMLLAKLLRIIGKNGIKNVSTSLGFFDKKINHSENILKMRNIKSKSGCISKAFISNCDVDTFSLYSKAGADIIGLDWKTAPNIVHLYNYMILNRNREPHDS